MTIDVREQVTEWLTGNDTCFLIGAGCSMCAGKPLIGKLTENVLNGADEALKRQFGALKGSGERPATIEDLINYLVRYRDILNTITNADGHSVTVDEIDSWLTDIKKKIVDEVADDWETSSFHERFLQRLRGPRDRSPRDIFSLNYDTLLEASLDSIRLPYTDGFRGTNRGWFDSSTFDEAGPGIAFRIFKLHGSINWTRDTSGCVRRGRNANEDAVDEPIVVYPSEQKYLQTQYGVYETLMGRFRNRLRIPGVNNCLVVLGYSFNDEHINEAICDAVNADNCNLTIIAFVGPEENRGEQVERLTAFGERCDSRFNAFIGNDQTGKFIGHALDEDAANAVLKGDFWKFENLIDFIAGTTI